MPQEMMTTHDNPKAPSIELRNHDKHASDTQDRIGHSTLDNFDLDREVYVESKGPCINTDGLNIHEIPTQSAERTADDSL